MKYIVEIPDIFQVTEKQLRQIISDVLPGAWHEPVKVSLANGERRITE